MLMLAHLALLVDEQFDFPTRQSLFDSQQAALKQRPPNSVLRDGLYLLPDGAVWIPTADVGLQLRLCIVGHCGRRGRRGQKVTEEIIRQHFY
jgi:hypothetical protein